MHAAMRASCLVLLLVGYVWCEYSLQFNTGATGSAQYANAVILQDKDGSFRHYGTSFTWEVWLRLYSDQTWPQSVDSTTYRWIMGQMASNGYFIAALFLDTKQDTSTNLASSASLVWHIYHIEGGTQTSTDSIDRITLAGSSWTTAWQHVALSYTADTRTADSFTAYVNGQSSNTFTGSLTAGSMSYSGSSPGTYTHTLSSESSLTLYEGSFWIARADPSSTSSSGTLANSNGWPGYIDEVRVWNGARTQSEIAADFYTSPATTGSANLLTYFSFDSWSGSGPYTLTSSDSANSGYADMLMNINTNAAQPVQVSNNHRVIISGTVYASGIKESDIWNGEKTLILTAMNGVWQSASTLQSCLVSGFDSGFQSVITASESGIVRTSDTVVTITLSADDSFTITSTTDFGLNVPATCFTVAQAAIASMDITIETDVANTPSGLTGSGDSESVTLTWTEYDTDIQSYFYQYKLSTDSTWTDGTTLSSMTTTSGTEVSTTISGLETSTDYDFRLRGTNSVGTGSYATVSNVNTVVSTLDEETVTTVTTTTSTATAVVVATSVSTSVTTSVAASAGTTVAGSTGASAGAGTAGSSASSSGSAGLGQAASLLSTMQFLTVFSTLDRSVPSDVTQMGKEFLWTNGQFASPFSVETNPIRRRLLTSVSEENEFGMTNQEFFISNVFWFVITMCVVILLHGSAACCLMCCCRVIRGKRSYRLPPGLLCPRFEVFYVLMAYQGLCMSSWAVIGTGDPLYVVLALLLVMTVLIPLPCIGCFILVRGTATGIISFQKQRRECFGKLRGLCGRDGRTPWEMCCAWLAFGWWLRTDAWKLGDWDGDPTFLGRFDVMFSDYSSFNRYFAVVDLIFKFVRAFSLGVIVNVAGGILQLTIISVMNAVVVVWIICRGLYADRWDTFKELYSQVCQLIIVCLGWCLPSKPNASIKIDTSGVDQDKVGAALTIVVLMMVSFRVVTSLWASLTGLTGALIPLLIELWAYITEGAEEEIAEAAGWASDQLVEVDVANVDMSGMTDALSNEGGADAGMTLEFGLPQAFLDRMGGSMDPNKMVPVFAAGGAAAAGLAARSASPHYQEYSDGSVELDMEVGNGLAVELTDIKPDPDTGELIFDLNLSYGDGDSSVVVQDWEVQPAPPRHARRKSGLEAVTELASRMRTARMSVSNQPGYTMVPDQSQVSQDGDNASQGTSDRLQSQASDVVSDILHGTHR